MSQIKIPQGEYGTEYREVNGFPGYAVGSDGTLWSRHNNRHRLGHSWKRVNGVAQHSGHLVATLVNVKGERVRFMVHRIVLEAFVGPCPEGMEARHFPDRDPTNNRIENLQWGTRLQNQRDRYVQGTDQFGERNPQAKLTEENVVKIRELYATGDYFHKDIAKMFGVSRKAVCFITQGKRWPNTGGPITDGSSNKFLFDSETAKKAQRGEKINDA